MVIVPVFVKVAGAPPTQNNVPFAVCVYVVVVPKSKLLVPALLNFPPRYNLLPLVPL